MKAVDVVTEIDIARPIDAVATYTADPHNAPQWYANIDSVQWRTGPPLRVGAVVGFVARFLRRRLAYDYEIIEHAPGARLVMRTSQGPFPMETTYTWDARTPDVTHMTLRNRGTPSGFSAIASILIVRAMRRANRNDLARLKVILESTPSPGSTI